MKSYLEADEVRKPDFYRAVENISKKCHPGELSFGQPDVNDNQIAEATSQAAMQMVLDRSRRSSKDDSGSDFAAGGYTDDRATVRQKKTRRPVRFELSAQIRRAVDDYLKAANKRTSEFLFAGHRGPNRSMTTRQYARLVSEWIGSVGLDPRLFGTHSLRRTKATLIYRRTENLRTVRSARAYQDRKHGPVSRHRADDALAIAEQVDV